MRRRARSAGQRPVLTKPFGPSVSAPDQERPDNSRSVAAAELKSGMGQFASWVDEQHPDAAESLRVGLYEFFTRSPTGSGRCPALCTIARIRPVACSVPRSMIGGAFGAARREFVPNRQNSLAVNSSIPRRSV